MIADSFRHVERYCGFDSLHSSPCLRTQTGCLGECRPTPAIGRLQTQRSTAKTEQPRSTILDLPAHHLAGLEVRLNDRAAGNRNILASRSVQTVLVEVVASETTGSPADWFGDPKADPHDGNRQPDMGSTSHTRGIEKTGIHDLRTNGVALDAYEEGKAVANVDDVCSKSRRGNGFDRLLHRSDSAVPCVVRFRRSCP